MPAQNRRSVAIPNRGFASDAPAALLLWSILGLAGANVEADHRWQFRLDFFSKKKCTPPLSLLNKPS